MEYLVVGKIVDTFSLDGSIKVLSSSTNESLRFKKDSLLLTKDGDEYKEHKITSSKKAGNVYIIHFEDILNVDEAAKFKGKELFVLKDINDLKEGYYFFSDLKGCTIISEGKELGKVIAVEEFPAQITLRAKTNGGKEFFIPFVKAFIKKVSIENKQIEINYMEGML